MVQISMNAIFIKKAALLVAIFLFASMLQIGAQTDQRQVCKLTKFGNLCWTVTVVEEDQ
jgi:hypothetical protein